MAYLVVDQAPLLEKSVDTHDGADISRKVPPTCRDSQVFGRVQAVCVDHEIAIVLVDGRGLASVTGVEELGQGLAFEVVYLMHIEPGAVAGEDDGVCLFNEVAAGSRLDVGLCLLRLGFKSIFYGLGSVVVCIVWVVVVLFGILLGLGHFFILELVVVWLWSVRGIEGVVRGCAGSC